MRASSSAPNSLDFRHILRARRTICYTKLVHRFDAVRRLLDTRPQLRRAIVVLQIATALARGLCLNTSEFGGRARRRIRASMAASASQTTLPAALMSKPLRQETLFRFYRRAGCDGNAVARRHEPSFPRVRREPRSGDPGCWCCRVLAGAARELDTALIANPFAVVRSSKRSIAPRSPCLSRSVARAMRR